MREILFKGAESDRDKRGKLVWHEGYPKIRHNKISINRWIMTDHCSIITISGSEIVDIEIQTISQYTGYKKGGVKIFENDVIREWVQDSVEELGGTWCYRVIKMVNGTWSACSLLKGNGGDDNLDLIINDEFQLCESFFDMKESLYNG